MEFLVSSANHVPRSRWLLAHALLVFSFLYLPIAVLVLYSFNGQGVGGFPPHHLTLDWYRMLFADGAIWDSVLNSLQVAFAAMGISLALRNSSGAGARPRTFSRQGFVSPVGTATAHSAWHYHGTVAAYAVQRDGRELEFDDARDRARDSFDFGRDHRSLCRVAETRSSAGRGIARFGSELLANVLAGDGAQPEAANHRRGLLIFTLSMDEIAVSFFLIGRDNTLPLEIWGRLRRGITPEINAVSTIIFVFSLVTIVVWYRLRVRAEGSAEVGAELIESAAPVKN